jgi:hypothetical protein
MIIRILSLILCLLVLISCGQTGGNAVSVNEDGATPIPAITANCGASSCM